jgi:DNA-directed RNA polymerase specialized sigma24 family protein
VYDRYFRDVYRYVAGRLDTEAADDIAAETFLLAYGGSGAAARLGHLLARGGDV